MQQFLTYQHNVQKFFLRHEDKYSGVMIPLTIISGYPSGTYGFIRALCSRHSNIEYAIDPRNAMFQKQWKRDLVRPPHERVAQIFGEPYVTDGLTRQLQPTDFRGSLLEDHVKSCVTYQLQFREHSEDARKMKKYKMLAGDKEWKPLKNPQHIIPPYFEFSGPDDPWLQLSMEAVQLGIDCAEGIPVRPVFHFSDWENFPVEEVIAPRAEAMGLDKVWLYPNNFREHEVEESELVAFRDSVSKLCSKNITPCCLFGGYFALLMSEYGLQSFGNGIGYGEWRDSAYHKGGSASRRIYVLRLHRYVDAPAAELLIGQHPDYFGVGSPIMQKYVREELSLNDMTQEESLDHFMYCREEEMNFVETSDLSALISELRRTVEVLSGPGLALQSERYSTSLTRWADVIEDVVE